MSQITDAQTLAWKPDWPQARANLTRWWNRQGPALSLTAPRRQPIEPLPEPAAPSEMEARWTNPLFRCEMAEFDLSHTYFAAEAFPYFDTHIGPGSLGLFLGAKPGYDAHTVWYVPSISDPDTAPPLRFDPQNPRQFMHVQAQRCWEQHLGLIEIGLRRAKGRYLVGMPDLIENIDTLAALRDNEPLMMDLIERPAWVHARLQEINQAFFTAFDWIHDKIRGPEGGNAFSAFKIWGPGKTAKVQCDAACMLSPAMFREFVVPYLSAQCDWLDYSIFHLDGTNALQHLDTLLAIESLDAIEWTPQAGRPSGGAPIWYDLYRRIKRGGKSIQAVYVAPHEVIPLLDAVGPEGTFVMTWADDEEQAEQLAAQVQKYR